MPTCQGIGRKHCSSAGLRSDDGRAYQTFNSVEVRRMIFQKWLPGRNSSAVIGPDRCAGSIRRVMIALLHIEKTRREAGGSAETEVVYGESLCGQRDAR